MYLLQSVAHVLLLSVQELEFWGLNEAEIEPCCWGNYARFQSHKETLNNLESTFGGGGEIPLEECLQRQKSRSCWKRYQSKVWVQLEYPSASKLAKVSLATGHPHWACSMLRYKFNYLTLQTAV